MRNFAKTVTAILLTTGCAFAQAQSTDLDEWLERIVETQSAGYEAIDDLTRKSTTMGTAIFEFYEKVPPFEAGGMMIHTLRMVPPSEIQQRHNEAHGIESPSAREMAAAADQIEMVGIDMERQMMSEMQETGLPGGMGPMLMNPPPDKPWLSANPRDMTSMYAMMLRAGADAEAIMEAERAGIPAEYARNMQEMRSKTSVRGFSEWNGKRVVDIGGDNLGIVQDNATCDSMQTLVDVEEHVPLYFKMDCSVTEGGETRQMSIEREAYDFQTGAGCGDYREPFRTVMRIGGAMTPEQEAQLAEASEQLAELETQMASMPASQRQMMERMMGPQLEMIRNMSSSGKFEIVQEVTELRCNTGLPDPAEIAQTFMGGMAMTPAAAGPMSEDSMLQMIQGNLETLGYQPGNTNGVMDKGTAVAISQFQAAQGMEVTGQPSPQLAGILSAAVDAM